MPRDLFGDVTDPSVRVGSGKWYTVPLSLFVHTTVLLLFVVIPLMATGALPVPRDANVVVMVDPVPLPDPPPARRVKSEVQPKPTSNVIPFETPAAISPETFERALDSEIPTDLDIPGLGFVDGRGVAHDAPPPPPPPPPIKPVPVGGSIKRPERLQGAPPVYPTAARFARIEGVVIIEATIGTDGRVQDARLLRSHPMLEQAALEAVREWVYSPTLLNGVPVPVIMTVTVHFTLGRPE
jgi:periplasmic protein TonB